MTTFALHLALPDGDRPLSAAPTRLYNLGSATVDSAAAEAHQREVADVGVRIAFDVPAPRIYPMAVNSVTTDDVVGVHSGRTSGEAEVVLLVSDGELYIGVGSDHTDRELERLSIIWSKQYSPSVLGKRVWRWADVEPRWDRLVLESTVDGELYQRGPASVFLSPPEILKVLGERVSELPPSYLVFCGTYTSIDNRIRHGGQWTAALHDPETGARLELSYRVVDLLAEIETGFRVPLRPKER
ncbi:DUF2848 family protein [Actinokineospora pegani]|uniref:DUF2848 family protein n=1 Tax=Actinokineospora pegani TaxID=2654637 RepID=UPI0012EA2825|nr:DUF2848 family protein [Actinokineospora pegani]